MILNIRYLIFVFLIFIGFYIFNLEYQNLINYNFKVPDIKLSKNDREIVNKKINNKILDFKIEENETIETALNKNEVKVLKGDTFFSILKNYNFSDKKIFQIINKIEDYYDLKKLKINDKILVYNDIDNKIKRIVLNINFSNQLVIDIDNEIVIKEKKLEKNSYQTSFEFQIFSSLYADGMKNKVPEDILIKLIKLFSFDLDFQRDIRKDTIVSVSFEFNQIKDSSKIEYKDINYALIKIDNKKLEYFKFITEDGFVDYFNREGKNVKKSILKTPLDGARLSSNFGMRKHPISGYNKMHKGVDFAAPKGTPVYAGGNGVIEYVGKNGGYGKYIRIRHNNEYKTAYAHLSSYNKGIKKGIRVNQGEIIGFVGSTGNSTGPHLHYEILYQNKHINPLKLKLPSGKILEGDELKRFTQEYKKIYADHLNLLYE